MGRMLIALGTILAAALLIGSLERREHEVTAEAAGRAVARWESLPPEARLGHPLSGTPYVEQSYRKANGERVVERRYTPHADLTTRAK